VSDTTWTVAEYTAQYDEAMRPASPEAGDLVRYPRSDGDFSTSDGRECAAWRTVRQDAGFVEHYSHTDGDWDYWKLIVDLEREYA